MNNKIHAAIYLFTACFFSVPGASFASEVEINVRQTYSADFSLLLKEKKIYTKYFSNYNVKKSGIQLFMEESIEERGVKIVPAQKDISNITIIENNINPGNYRMSPPNFFVDKSIDIMFCININSSIALNNSNCNHVVFEYYSKKVYNENKLYNYIWQKLITTEPIRAVDTFAFTPSKIEVIYIDKDL